MDNLCVHFVDVPVVEAAFAWFETMWETEQLQDFLYFFPSDDYNSNWDWQGSLISFHELQHRETHDDVHGLRDTGEDHDSFNGFRNSEEDFFINEIILIIISTNKPGRRLPL